MVSWKFFWGGDLEEPFNVGENLTKYMLGYRRTLK
jgi:hypothetical protein